MRRNCVRYFIGNAIPYFVNSDSFAVSTLFTFKKSEAALLAIMQRLVGVSKAGFSAKLTLVKDKLLK